MKKIVLLVFLAVALCVPSFAGSPLSRAIGARSLALGNAFVGLANDASAIYINPAGLGNIKLNLYASMYSQPESDITFASLGGAIANWQNGTLGIGYQNNSISNVIVSRETVSFTDQGLILSYSRKIRKKLSIGADVRFISTGASKVVPGFEGLNGSGYAFDVSALYNVSPRLNLGAVIQNIKGEINYQDNTTEKYDLNFILGSSLMMGDAWGPRLYINADLAKEGGDPVLGHFGFEAWPTTNFAFRVGFDQTKKTLKDTYTHLTGGIGMKFSGVTFDMSLYKHSDPTEAFNYSFSIGYVGPDEKPPIPTIEVHEITVADLKHFPDVPYGYWARKPIEYLTTLGILNYYEDGSFRPDRPIARAETVVLLGRAKDYPEPKEKKQVFSDVPTDYWAANFIQKAYEYKLALGYPDKTFKPRKATSRAEGVTFISRFAKPTLKDVLRSPYPDLPLSHWAIKEILAAKEADLLKFLRHKPFRPSQQLTRAEFADLIYRTKYAKEKIKEAGLEY